jgi:hypothetical protein
MYFKLDY